MLALAWRWPTLGWHRHIFIANDFPLLVRFSVWMAHCVWHFDQCQCHFRHCEKLCLDSDRAVALAHIGVAPTHFQRQRVLSFSMFLIQFPLH